MIDNSAMKKEGKADLVQDQPDVTDAKILSAVPGSSAGGREEMKEDHALSDTITGLAMVVKALTGSCLTWQLLLPRQTRRPRLLPSLSRACGGHGGQELKKRGDTRQDGNTKDLLDVAAGAPSAAADANPPVTDGHIPGSTMDGTVPVPGSGSLVTLQLRC